jgi:hypothetical protein
MICQCGCFNVLSYLHKLRGSGPRGGSFVVMDCNAFEVMVVRRQLLTGPLRNAA